MAQMEDQTHHEDDERRPVVDETYYYEHGDCMFLVGGVLFKVHRYQLMRESSTFTTMYDLSPGPPPTGRPRQGSTPDEPIVLQDDVKEFRALCWALYALPVEIFSQSDANRVDIPRLISLAYIGRKYQFESLEKWSLDLLTTHITSQLPCPSLDTCPTEASIKALEMAVLSDRRQLQELTIEKLLNRARKGQLDIPYALTAAERLNLRDLQGSLYYAQLIAMSKPLAPSAIDFTTIQSKIASLSLTPDQKIKLCMGAWSLTLFWSKITGTILNDQPREFFSRAHWNCICYWASGGRAALTRPLATELDKDHLERTRQMVNASLELTEADFKSMCSTCRTKGSNMAKEELAKAEKERNLADYFLGAQG
ncbi:hypothetical protein AX16_004577 [Volvariella volvacea WC 439]|nr:hypothetical protein AX16_004577 [Volvariella volvacea WC 439]